MRKADRTDLREPCADLRDPAELAERIAQLEQAVESHAVIDQAIGVVMTVAGCEQERAFLVLRDASQRSNTKLRLVARQVTDWARSGSIDPRLAQLLAEGLSQRCGGRMGTRGRSG